MPIEFFIFGAGGHAKVVLDAIQRLGTQVEVLDDDHSKVGRQILGTVIRSPEPLSELPPYGHIAVGDNRVRAGLVERFAPHIVRWFSVIHPLASIAESAAIADGVFVAAQAVVGPSCCVETATLINHAAVVDHDCHIGSCCHIAPNATLGGGVRLGDGVLVGSGAVVLPGVHVGNNAVIGAGAVVTRDVSASSTVVGVPAKTR